MPVLGLLVIVVVVLDELLEVEFWSCCCSPPPVVVALELEGEREGVGEEDITLIQDGKTSMSGNGTSEHGVKEVTIPNIGCPAKC